MVFLKVEREEYVKNDRTFYSYFVKGKIRGKSVRVSITPPDVGGYTVLDIVFGESNEADLVVEPFEMKDNTGKIIKGNTFKVRTTDIDGEVYECSIKPLRPSDKALLNMLVK